MATKVKLIADGVITPDQITLTTASAGTNTTAPATTAFVQQEITALVDSSPSALNTLNELAAALGDDENFSTTVNSNIATKLPLAGGTLTGALTMNVPPTINNARVLVQRSNDDSSITFANNASGAPSSHTWAIGLDYSASNGLAIAYSASGIPSLTGNNLIQINTSGNVEIGTSNPSGNKGITIQAGTDSSASLRLKNDAHDWDINCQTNDKFAIYSHTAGTERLVINTSGNVGIGTNNPDYQLHIAGGGDFLVEDTGNGSAHIRLRSSSGGTASSNWKLKTGNNNYFYIDNDTGNAGTAIAIDNTGNVGIGTTTPDYNLEVEGASGTTVAIKTPWAANAYGQYKFQTTVGEASIRSRVPGNSTIGLEFYTYGSNNGTAKMSILGDGNVGIGETDPNSKLSIVGGATSPGLSIKSGGNAGVDPFRVTWTNGTEGSMFIVDDSGNVGIGESSPDTRLHIKKNQSSANSSIKLENAAGGNNSSFSIDWQLASSGTSAQIKGNRSNSPGAGDSELIFSTSTTGTTLVEAMRIDSSGRVGIGTNNPQTSTKGLHVVHDATEGTPSFPSGEVIIAQRNFNSSQGCHIGIIGGSASDSAINFGDKDNSDAGIIRYHHNGDFLGFTTNTTEHWKMLANGSFQPTQQHTKDIGGVNAEVRNIYANALYVGGSAAANKLDDYEEGTWTPDLRNSTTSLSTQTWAYGPTAHYTKIGDLVFVHLSGKLSGIGGTSTGELRIFGLPFSGKSTGGYQEYRMNFFLGNQPNTADSYQAFAFVRNNGTDFGTRLLAGGDNIFTSNRLDNDTFFTIFGSYKTNQ